MACAPDDWAIAMIAWVLRQLSRGGAGPSRCASSQAATCIASASASEYTATVAIAMRRAVRATRQAISPRLAIRILSNIARFLRLGHVGRSRAPEPAQQPFDEAAQESPQLRQQPRR